MAAPLPFSGQTIPDWLSALFALGALITAVIALVQTRRAARTAGHANELSADANRLAAKANQQSSEALRLQCEEQEVRILVRPRIVREVSRNTPDSVRVAVEIVNLSAFPVTIKAIWWSETDKTATVGDAVFRPMLTDPYTTLPARLPSRDAVVALLREISREDIETMRRWKTCVVNTACGLAFEGGGPEWTAAVQLLVDDPRFQ